MFLGFGIATVFIPLAALVLCGIGTPEALKTPARAAPYWGVAAALSALVAVAAGAYLAHGSMSAAALSIPETAARYQLTHSLALLATALLAGIQRDKTEKALTVAGWAFAFGMLFFCGTLYLQAGGITAVSGLAPLGGLLLMLGWLAFAVSLWRRLK